jgi:hypothetical protein
LRAQVRELKVALLVKGGEIEGLKDALGAQADGTRGGIVGHRRLGLTAVPAPTDPGLLQSYRDREGATLLE